MRVAPLCAGLVAALVLAAGAGGAVSPDRKAVRAAVAAARTLDAAVAAQQANAKAAVERELPACRGVQQPAGTVKLARVKTLTGMEAVRHLQHDSLADYERFVEAVQALRFADPRLVAAQGALTGELATLRKLAAVPIAVCDDLRDFARGGYSAAALVDWAKRIDAKAHVSEDAGARTDRVVRRSRAALVAAGLPPLSVRLLLRAETGDVFVAA